MPTPPADAFSPAAFRRKWWMPSGHLETASALAEKNKIDYLKQIVNTPDDDPILLCWLRGQPKKPAVVIFHGLEGCAQSHTVRTLAAYFSKLGWTVAAPHFRSCGIMNRHPRAYHAADNADVLWMLKFLCASLKREKVFAVGVSLGGNALIKCLDSHRDAPVIAAAAVSAPLNLPAAAKRLSKGTPHLVYGRHFVKLLREKVRKKAARHPALGGKKFQKIRTIGDFDRAYTAPVHGFASAEEYWQAGSAENSLLRMKTPLICINAQNDPFVPAATLPKTASEKVMLCRPKHGGHGAFTGAPQNWLGDTVRGFFAAQHNA